MIVRNYADGSSRVILKNLTSAQADRYMSTAVTSGSVAGKGTFQDSKVPM